MGLSHRMAGSFIRGLRPKMGIRSRCRYSAGVLEKYPTKVAEYAQGRETRVGGHLTLFCTWVDGDVSQLKLKRLLFSRVSYPEALGERSSGNTSVGIAEVHVHSQRPGRRGYTRFTKRSLKKSPEAS